MIVVMKQGVNLITIETVAQAFRGKGYDVLIRDPKIHGSNPEEFVDGRVVLAVIGEEGGNKIDPLFVEGLPGVDRRRTVRDNAFFLKYYPQFVEAWQFSVARDSKANA